MIRRRTLLWLGTVALVGTGGVVVGRRVGPGRTQTGDPLPSEDTVRAEFASGETALFASVMVSKSEDAWLRRNHPSVDDPVALAALLRQ